MGDSIMGRKDELTVNYSAKEIMQELQEMKKTLGNMESKLDTGIETLKAKSAMHQRLIFGSYGFGMFILGILIAHAVR